MQPIIVLHSPYSGSKHCKRHSPSSETTTDGCRSSSSRLVRPFRSPPLLPRESRFLPPLLYCHPSNFLFSSCHHCFLLLRCPLPQSIAETPWSIPLRPRRLQRLPDLPNSSPLTWPLHFLHSLRLLALAHFLQEQESIAKGSEMILARVRR